MPTVWGAASGPAAKAIQPAASGRRKVVLATNIAETSLTIEGIRLVVDSGLERVARYDVRNGLTRLATQRISQASMVQRAGRAGRLEPGICWHLFAKEQAERAAEHAEPDILQSDLTGFWLELLQWGCHDPAQLIWLDAPPAAALAAARALLHRLGPRMTAANLPPRAPDGRAGVRAAAGGDAGRRRGAECRRPGDGGVAGGIAGRTAARRQMDIGYWLSRPQPNWRQRAAQLTKRLPQRAGQIDVDLAPRLLAQAFTDRIAQRRGQDGRYLLANGLGRR